jgi:imidazolonepropionase-like amidohydrolase
VRTLLALAILLAPSEPVPPAALVLTNATVIDATGSPPQPNRTVVIRGNRITALGRTGRVAVPKGAQVVDAAGKFVIPGLWDMHVHFAEVERSLPLFVANGVLGVRNMGGKAEDQFRWRDAVKTGMLLGPRIVACGPILDGPQPTAADHYLSIGTPAEGRKAVADLARGGADCIKVYDGLPRDAYFAIADEAKKRAIPFVGHVPVSIAMSEASDAGQKSVEHLGSVWESSSSIEAEVRSHVDPPITDGNFSEYPRRIAARGERLLDTHDARKAALLFAKLARNGTWQVPTLLFKRVHTHIDDVSRGDDPSAKYVPASDREWWSPTKNFLFRYRTPAYITHRKRLFPKELEIVGAMHRAGVPIMAGTDTNSAYNVPGFSLHRELALLVEAGLTPMEALQAATRNPAKFLGRSKDLGTVERGKLADLVLLDANPLENIANTERIYAVVVNGRYLPKATLEEMLVKVAAAAVK